MIQAITTFLIIPGLFAIIMAALIMLLGGSQWAVSAMFTVAFVFAILFSWKAQNV